MAAEWGRNRWDESIEKTSPIIKSSSSTTATSSSSNVEKMDVDGDDDPNEGETEVEIRTSIFSCFPPELVD